MFNISASTDKINRVLIKWQTGDEENTSCFNIQRSIGGDNFSTIGKVNARGSGNHNYSYFDSLTSDIPHLPIVYYRLQEFDRDNNSSFSTVASVSLNTNSTSFIVFPNPASNTLNIQGTGIKQIQVINNTGQTIINQNENNVDLVVLNISKLPSGFYYVIITDRRGVNQKNKIIIK